MTKTQFTNLTTIYLISAVGANGAIGNSDGSLPWHYPTDFRTFRDKTWGHVVVMGRKTFDGIEKVLDGRTVIVQSRHETKVYSDGRYAYSDGPLACDQIVAYAERYAKRLWIAGGREIYALWLDWAKARRDVAVECHVTLVPYHGSADVHMPKLWS